MGLLDEALKALWSPSVNKGSSFYPQNFVNQIGYGGSGINFNNQDEQKLINKGYGSNVTVYSIINKIITTASTIPLIVWDTKTDEEVESGRLFEFLKQPAIYRGEMLSTSEWVESALVYLLTTGNLYQRKISLVNQKAFDSYEIYPSGITEPIAPNSYLLPNSGFKVTDKQNQFKVESEEMSHLKYINPTMNGLNTLVGLAPLQAGLYALTGSTDVQEALSVLIKNQGTRGLLTNKTNRNGGGVNMTPEIAKEVKRQIKDMISGVSKVGSVGVTSAELQYLPMGMSAGDLKLIESGVLTDRMLCNIWGVDSKLFNDPTASTFNNLQDATKGMYVNAILPSLGKLVSNLNQDIAKSINNAERTSQEVRIDTSRIEALQKNQKEEADKNKVNAEGINTVLNYPISNESKVESLVYLYDMTEEKANNIIGDGIDESAED